MSAESRPAGHRLPGHLRNRYLLLLDALVLPLAAWLAFAIRLESTTWPAGIWPVLSTYAAVVIPLKLYLMWRLGLYSRLWRYAGVRDLEFLATALGGAALASLAVGLGLIPLLSLVFDFAFARVPLSAIALDALLSAAFVAMPRVLVRAHTTRAHAALPHDAKRALIVGAGAAGSMIVHELLDNAQLGLVPVAFLDDDPSKRNRWLHGVEIVGSIAELKQVVRTSAIDEVIIAMPSVPGRIVREIVRQSTDAGVATRTVPGLFELLNGSGAWRSTTCSVASASRRIRSACAR